MEITDEVLSQMARVRRSGKVNMLDRFGVQRIANELNQYALVVFIQETIEDRRGIPTFVKALEQMGERSEEFDSEADPDDYEEDEDEEVEYQANTTIHSLNTRRSSWG